MRTLVFRGERIPLGGNLRGSLGGIAYFCPTCGELWARAILSNTKSWMVATSPCENHGTLYLFRTGGTVLNPLVWWDKTTPETRRGYLDSATPELLRFEALRLAEQILKG